MALVCRKNRFTRYGAKNCTEHPSCRAIRTQYKLATDLFSPSETLQPSDIPIEQVKHVLCSACCFLVSHRPMFSFPPFLLFSPSSSFFTIEGSHSLAANLQQGNVIAFCSVRCRVWKRRVSTKRTVTRARILSHLLADESSQVAHLFDTYRRHRKNNLSPISDSILLIHSVYLFRLVK